jgi:predicted dienelactone hydrolase
VTGQGLLIVLAHGIGDSRHSSRFLAPALAAAGYRVANVDDGLSAGPACPPAGKAPVTSCFSR